MGASAEQEERPVTWQLAAGASTTAIHTSGSARYAIFAITRSLTSSPVGQSMSSSA